MNEDLLDTPVHYQIKGTDWWIQEIHNSYGDLVMVNLYDKDGYFVGEYSTVAEAIKTAENNMIH